MEKIIKTVPKKVKIKDMIIYDDFYYCLLETKEKKHIPFTYLSNKKLKEILKILKKLEKKLKRASEKEIDKMIEKEILRIRGINFFYTCEKCGAKNFYKRGCSCYYYLNDYEKIEIVMQPKNCLTKMITEGRINDEEFEERLKIKRKINSTLDRIIKGKEEYISKKFLCNHIDSYVEKGDEKDE